MENLRALDTVDDDDCDEKTETMPGLGWTADDDTDQEMALTLSSGWSGDGRICSRELRGLLPNTVNKWGGREGIIPSST